MDFKWVVEFTVDPVWVADGFELTKERAQEMLANALPYAHGHELAVRIIKAPDQSRIRKEQGYKK